MNQSGTKTVRYQRTLPLKLCGKYCRYRLDREVKVNDHSRRIFNRSILLINQYRNKEIGLRRLVNALEGSLNALEEKMPEEFLERWFSYWGDLETVLASGNEEQSLDDIYKDLDGLERIISISP